MTNLLLLSCIIINIYDVPSSHKIKVELINSKTKEIKLLYFKDHEEMDAKYEQIETISLDMNKQCR